MTVVPCAASSRNRDVPKSATLTRPLSATRTLAGRRSRWMHALAVGVVDGVADLAREVEGPRQLERAVAAR